MRLIYRGIYKDEDQLPKSNLPVNAVQFKEPKPYEERDPLLVLSVLVSLALVGLCVLGSYLLHGGLTINFSLLGLFLGLIIATMLILFHEILHAIPFGRGTKVELYIVPKHLEVFVVCEKPLTKFQYIFMLLLPIITLGWFPMIVWMIFPHGGLISNILLVSSYITILTGIGDYVNAYRALYQMPNGSMHQQSGHQSYWYMPEGNDTISAIIYE